MNAQVKVPKSLAKRGEDANLMGLRCVHQDFLGIPCLLWGRIVLLSASPDLIIHVSDHSDLEASCPG